MPLRGNVRYRVVRTGRGPVRLAFDEEAGEVVEAKNLKTGATHTPKQFASERRKTRR